LIKTGIKSKTDLPDSKRDDIYTICYTSGTTGEPKGSMSTHYNFLITLEGFISRGVDINDSDVHLSYLPLAHLMERVISICIMCVGGSIGYFTGDILKLKEDM